VSVDPRDLIRRRSVYLGFDPDIADAVSLQESGGGRNVYGDIDELPYDPRSIEGPGGKRYASLGPFQENVVGGAGETYLRKGGALADLFDPISATERFVERFRREASLTFPGETPGQIAARAQRPADPRGYANSIDAIIGDLRSQKQRQADAAAPSLTTSEDWEPAGWQCALIATTGNADPAVLSAITGIPRERLQDAAYKCAAGVGKAKIPGEEQVAALGAIAGSIGAAAEGIDELRKGSAQALVAAGVLGAAALLVWSGLRKTLG
jgi:hypothetical protein